MNPEIAQALRRTLRMLCLLLPVAVAMLLTAHYLPGWIYGVKEEAAGTDARWQRELALAQLEALKAVPPPAPPPELPAMAVPPKPPPPPQVQREVVVKPVPVPVPVPAPAPQQARPPAASRDNNVLVRNMPSTPSTVVAVPPATPVVTVPPVPVVNVPPSMQTPPAAPANPVPAPAITNAPATNLTSTNLAQAVIPPARTNTTNSAVRTNPPPQTAQAPSANPAPGRGFVGPSNLPLPPASPDIIRLSIP